MHVYIYACVCIHAQTSMRACVSCLHCHQITNCGVFLHLFACRYSLSPVSTVVVTLPSAPASCVRLWPLIGRCFKDSQNPIGVRPSVHTHYNRISRPENSVTERLIHHSAYHLSTGMSNQYHGASARARDLATCRGTPVYRTGVHYQLCQCLSRQHTTRLHQASAQAVTAPFLAS